MCLMMLVLISLIYFLSVTISHFPFLPLSPLPLLLLLPFFLSLSQSLVSVFPSWLYTDFHLVVNGVWLKDYFQKHEDFSDGCTEENVSVSLEPLTAYRYLNRGLEVGPYEPLFHGW